MTSAAGRCRQSNPAPPAARRPGRAALGVVACLFAATPVLAHVQDEAPTLSDAWSLSPWVLVPLALLLLVYLGGVARLWRRAGAGRGITPSSTLAFAGGFVLLLLASVWPLDVFGAWLLSAHMAQHMLLLALVPPLLLAGRPQAALAHALPALARFTGPAVQRTTRSLPAATLLHCAVMWLWHAPAALALALRDDAVHGLMHASFLVAGFWFWSAVWQRLREPDTGAGAGVVALLVVMMQMGLLGGLLTFAPQPRYAHYLETAPALGWSALADQQLAGLLMWVPSGLPYLAGAIALMVLALRRL